MTKAVGKGALMPVYPVEWYSTFGRSPQCASYAEVWKAGGKYTFSDCEAGSTVVQAVAKSDTGSFPSQLPPGVIRKHGFDYSTCCGNCSLDIPEVRLLYFPDAKIGHCGKNQTLAVGPTRSGLGDILDKSADSSLGSGSTAVYSGHTL